jgi:hypothetical protein
MRSVREALPPSRRPQGGGYRNGEAVYRNVSHTVAAPAPGGKSGSGGS